MPRLSLQYECGARAAQGAHLAALDRRAPSSRQQQRHLNRLAAEPGDTRRGALAASALQLFAMLSLVHPSRANQRWPPAPSAPDTPYGPPAHAARTTRNTLPGGPPSSRDAPLAPLAPLARLARPGGMPAPPQSLAGSTLRPLASAQAQASLAPDVPLRPTRLPLASPVANGTLSWSTEVRAEPPGLRPLSTQLRRMRHFLRRSAYLGNSTHASPHLVLNALYTHLRDHGAAALERAAQVLLRGSDLYGERSGEHADPAYLQGVVDQFACRILFDGHDSLHGFAIDSLREASLSGPRGRSLMHVAALRRDIMQRINLADPRQSGSTPMLGGATRRALFDGLVTRALPTLTWSPHDSAAQCIEIGSLDWVYWHVGMRLAALSGSDALSLALPQWVELGRSVELLIRTQQVEPALLELFAFPAVLHHVRSNVSAAAHPAPANAAQRRLAFEALFAASDALADEARRTDPVTAFADALAAYRTRSELAREQLRAHCNPSDASVSAQVEDYKNAPDDFACRNATHEVSLPDLNALFDAQNVRIASHYATLDGLLFDQALARDIDDTTRVAMQRARVQSANARFSFFHAVRHAGPAAMSIAAHRNTLDVRLAPGVELLAVQINGAEHIYALRRDKHGTRLSRVDRQRDAYLLLIDDPRPFVDQDYALQINVERDTLKSSGAPLGILRESLRERHRQAFLQHLHASGYDATTREIVWRIALSLLPFHDCLTQALAQRQEAVVSCLIDVVSLLPVMAGAASLSMRFGSVLMRGTHMAWRATLLSAAAEHSLRAGLRRGAQTWVRQAALPAAATLDRAALVSLGIGALRAVDIGVEPACRLSRQAALALARSARALQSVLPALGKMAPRFEGLAARPTLPFDDLARLDGIAAPFAIRRSGEFSADGWPLATLVDALSGKGLGARYAFDGSRLLATRRMASGALIRADALAAASQTASLEGGNCLDAAELWRERLCAPSRQRREPGGASEATGVLLRETPCKAARELAALRLSLRGSELPPLESLIHPWNPGPYTATSLVRLAAAQVFARHQYPDLYTLCTAEHPLDTAGYPPALLDRVREMALFERLDDLERWRLMALPRQALADLGRHTGVDGQRAAVAPWLAYVESFARVRHALQAQAPARLVHRARYKIGLEQDTPLPLRVAGHDRVYLENTRLYEVSAAGLLPMDHLPRLAIETLDRAGQLHAFQVEDPGPLMSQDAWLRTDTVSRQPLFDLAPGRRLRPARGDRLVVVAAGIEAPQGAMSPGRRFLVLWGTQEGGWRPLVRVFSLLRGRSETRPLAPLLSCHLSGDPVIGMAVSDQGMVALCEQTGDGPAMGLRLLLLDRARRLRTINEVNAEHMHMRFSPDGRFLAYQARMGNYAGNVMLYDLVTYRNIVLPGSAYAPPLLYWKPSRKARLESIAFSTDERLVALLFESNEILVYDGSAIATEGKATYLGGVRVPSAWAPHKKRYAQQRLLAFDASFERLKLITVSQVNGQRANIDFDYLLLAQPAPVTRASALLPDATFRESPERQQAVGAWQRKAQPDMLTRRAPSPAASDSER